MNKSVGSLVALSHGPPLGGVELGKSRFGSLVEMTQFMS